MDISLFCSLPLSVKGPPYAGTLQRMKTAGRTHKKAAAHWAAA